ncbi:MAG TPA: hypothetical protein VFG08_08300 [Candidatus Polarisedimenticolia bacterium]|nr:hypothetical protein [Candidatus Polarisedimenticolia bacterium]
MSWNTESRPRRTPLLPALAALLIFAGWPATADEAKDPVKPSELRKVLLKVEKRLLKIEEALEEGDSGQVSTLLRLADEDLVRFLDGSGLESLLAMLARARQAVGEPEMRGAQEALRAIRAGLNPLSDYVVRRDAEVAYLAASRAVATTDLTAYTEALRQLDAAILAPLLMGRIKQARDAFAGGRAAMVGRNMEAGRSEVEAARAAIEGLRLAAALSQAVFGLEIAAEFIAEGHGMAARDQLRGGARALREAVTVAPQELQADLRQADEDVWGILDRLAKPLPEDPGTLVGALEMVEALRTGQQ